MNQKPMMTKELLDKYDKITREANKERALWYLLKANEKYIERYIEEDPSGHWFHRALRQVDVTGDGYTDMAIRELLNTSPLFWKMIEENVS